MSQYPLLLVLVAITSLLSVGSVFGTEKRAKLRIQAKVLGACDTSINNNRLLQQVLEIKEGLACTVRIKAFKRKRVTRGSRQVLRRVPVANRLVSVSEYVNREQCGVTNMLAESRTNSQGIAELRFSWSSAPCTYTLGVSHFKGQISQFRVGDFGYYTADPGNRYTLLFTQNFTTNPIPISVRKHEKLAKAISREDWGCLPVPLRCL